MLATHTLMSGGCTAASPHDATDCRSHKRSLIFRHYSRAARQEKPCGSKSHELGIPHLFLLKANKSKLSPNVIEAVSVVKWKITLLNKLSPSQSWPKMPAGGFAGAFFSLICGTLYRLGGILMNHALMAALLISSAVACQTVEMTGRSQFIVVSESQESQLGADAYKETLKKEQLSTRADWQAQLRRVGQRIAAAADKPEYKWEFNVIQGKEINAFALPGGKVAFWEGIMPVAQDDAGIAVIMGHEVAHAIARHGAERMSQTMGAQALGQLLSLGVGQVNPGLREDFLKLYGLGASVGVLMPWGRAQESEADRIGLSLMAKAGYDPAAALAFWERMSKVSGAKPPEFLSTHPSDETRMAQIRAWLPEARKDFRAR
jgi:Zn-dependent protease with chaperone function